MQYVEFDEPDFDGGNIHFRITVQEAIDRAKLAANHLPNNPDFKYVSDAAALDDFLTVHWAWLAD